MKKKYHCIFYNFIIVLFELSLCIPSTASAEFVQDWIQSFAQSDIEFPHTKSNIPFIPLAFLDYKYYEDKEINIEGEEFSFDRSTVSQALVLPFLATSRDIVMFGEWINWSKFETNSKQVESFEVLSVGLPVGWLHQYNHDWQIAAFALPIGHKSTHSDSSWQYEFMTGAFALYSQRDDLWWVFGVFADVGHGEDMYIPYMGASWTIDQQWTLSAILPGPALLYSPTPDTFFRFGLSPSGSSWSVEDKEQGDLDMQFDTWDFGVTAEHRLTGNIWGNIAVGVGGFRGLRVYENKIEGYSTSSDPSPYISIGINFKPEMLIP